MSYGENEVLFSTKDMKVEQNCKWNWNQKDFEIAAAFFSKQTIDEKSSRRRNESAESDEIVDIVTIL
jgi:hypothetical protein